MTENPLETLIDVLEQWDNVEIYVAKIGANLHFEFANLDNDEVIQGDLEV